MIRHIMPWQATGAGDVTILTAPGRRLCKLIRPDEIVEYDGAMLFEPDAYRLDGFDDIPRLLEDLAPRSDTCVIRGLLKPEFATRPQVLRRIHDAPSPRPGHVIRAPFMAAARRWLMIDFELPDCPPWVDPTDALLVGGYLRQQLPEPFRCARCVVQLSNSAGFKPGLRCHLWFWLDTALDKPELDRLLGHVEGVDRSVFGAVQMHYTAAPIFEDVDDPVPERLVVLPGYAEVQIGEIPEPARPGGFTRRRGAPLRRPGARSAGSRRPGPRPTWPGASKRSSARRPATGIRPSSASRPACSAWRRPATSTRATSRRASAAPSTSARSTATTHEIDTALHWAWEHAEPWQLERAGRRAQALAPAALAEINARIAASQPPRPRRAPAMTDAITRPPGLLGALVDDGHRRSPIDTRIPALVGAIAGFAAATGNGYVVHLGGDNHLPLNYFGAVVGETGMGKETALRHAIMIAEAGGVPPSNFSSDVALHRALADAPKNGADPRVRLVAIDEWGAPHQPDQRRPERQPPRAHDHADGDPRPRPGRRHRRPPLRQGQGRPARGPQPVRVRVLRLDAVHADQGLDLARRDRRLAQPRPAALGRRARRPPPARPDHDRAARPGALAP